MSGSHFVVGEAAILELDEDTDRSILSLFTPDELEHSDEWGRPHRYTASAGVVSDRLTALGVGRKYALRKFRQAVTDFYADAPPNPLFNEVAAPSVTPQEFLDRMTQGIVDRQRRSVTNRPLERLASRLQAQLLLSLTPDRETPVEYVLQDIIQHNPNGCVDLSDSARELIPTEVTGVSTVVLTEGRSDARTLSAAMAVTHPHLTTFMKFMDFQSNPEGGVDALLRLVKALSAARVASRFVAITDNDTAAHSAVKKLPPLPENFKVLSYPHLSLLENYPTRGPESKSLVSMDVNGLAGSLEMYMGRDVLSNRFARSAGKHSSQDGNAEPHLNEDSPFFPVQWGGFMDDGHARQGRLSAAHKKLARNGFNRKIKLSRSPNPPAHLDWEGMRAIIETIAHAFDE